MGALQAVRLVQWLPLVLASWSQVQEFGIPRPSARSVHVAVFDPVANQFWMHGGNSDGILPDLWTFDFDTGTWDLKQQLNQGPPPRGDHVAVWDRGGSLWIHGGYDGVTYFNDLWRYSAYRWTNFGTSGPSARSQHVAVWDASNLAIWIHGGAFECTLNQDVWKFDTRAGTWSRMTENANQPTARANHVAAWDGTNLALWIHAGYDRSSCGGSPLQGLKQDLWRYDTTASSNNWNLIAVGGPSARAYHVAGWDPAKRDLWIHGGFDGVHFCQDLWKFDVENYAWHLVANEEGPSPRFSHVGAWATGTSSFCVHGGYAEGRLENDLWCYVVTTTTTSYTISSTTTLSTSSSITLTSTTTATTTSTQSTTSSSTTFTTSSSTSTVSSTSSATVSTSSTTSTTTSSTSLTSTSSTSSRSTTTTSTKSSTTTSSQTLSTTSSTTSSTTTSSSTSTSTFTSTTTVSTSTTTSSTSTTTSTTSRTSSTSSSTTSTSTTTSYTMTTTSVTSTTSTTSSTTGSTTATSSSTSTSTTMSSTTSHTSSTTLSTTTTSSFSSTSSTISTSSTSSSSATRTTSTSLTLTTSSITTTSTSITRSSSTSSTKTSSSSTQTTSTETTRTSTSSSGTMTTSTSSTITTTTTPGEDLTAVYILCPLAGLAVIITITWGFWWYLRYLRVKRAIIVPLPPAEPPQMLFPWPPEFPPAPMECQPPDQPPDPPQPPPTNLQQLHHPAALPRPCPAHPGRSSQRPSPLPDLRHLEPRSHLCISVSAPRTNIVPQRPAFLEPLNRPTRDPHPPAREMQSEASPSIKRMKMLRPTEEQRPLTTPATRDIADNGEGLLQAAAWWTKKARPERLPQPDLQARMDGASVVVEPPLRDLPCLNSAWCGPEMQPQQRFLPSSDTNLGPQIDRANMCSQLGEVSLIRTRQEVTDPPSLVKNLGDRREVCTAAPRRCLADVQPAPILNTPAQNPPPTSRCSSEAGDDPPSSRSRSSRFARSVSQSRARTRWENPNARGQRDRRDRTPGPGFYNTDPDPNQFGWIPGRQPGFPRERRQLSRPWNN